MSTYLTVKQMVQNTVKDTEGNDSTTESELTFVIPYATVSFYVADEANNTVRALMNNGTTHVLDNDNATTFMSEYLAFLNKGNNA